MCIEFKLKQTNNIKRVRNQEEAGPVLINVTYQMNEKQLGEKIKLVCALSLN
jgi:hypothetical protein